MAAAVNVVSHGRRKGSVRSLSEQEYGETDPSQVSEDSHSVSTVKHC